MDYHLQLIMVLKHLAYTCSYTMDSTCYRPAEQKNVNVTSPIKQLSCYLF